MMLTRYNRLENGPIDEIDAAIFSSDTFYNAEAIQSFREIMERWERGLKDAEDIIKDLE